MEQSSSRPIPISIDVDMLAVASKQPGYMETPLLNQSPENINVETLLVRNGQANQVEQLLNVHSFMPFNLEPQQLATSHSYLLSGSSPEFLTPVSAFGSHPLPFRSKQPIQVNQSLRAHSFSSSKMNAQQPLSSIKQSSQKEPAIRVLTVPSGYKDSKQAPTSKLAKLEPLPKVQTLNPGSTQLSLKNKRKTQVETPPLKVQSINTGIHIASMTNRKTASSEPSSKMQTESFESVRSKMRESLVAALALVSKGQNHFQATEKSSSSPETKIQEGDICSAIESVSSCAVVENSSESLSSKVDADMPLKPGETSVSESEGLYTDILKCGMQDFNTKHTSLEGNVPFNNNTVFKDELLQENGLCWVSDLSNESFEVKESDPKRLKWAVEEVSKASEEPANRTEHLAAKIEAELFRLFGGVNKKYKEKGRSLLFNLKDPNNPELRERVFSEEITPECFCSMTAEELASKQLSEWRIAKAEELAQMVVLSESDVDMRCLVKKTHKGEFQVEVDRDDTVPLDISASSNALSNVSIRSNETKSNTAPTSNEVEISTKHNINDKSDGSVATEKIDLGGCCPQDMQGITMDDLKDAEFLPPIVSLDEFMEALDSEPPFEDIPMDVQHDSPTNKKQLDSPCSWINTKSDGSYAMSAISKSSDSKSNNASNILVSKSDKNPDGLLTKKNQLCAASTDQVDSTLDHPDELGSRRTRIESIHELGCSTPSVLDDSLTPKDENIWQGLLQLNVSSLVTVWGFFKSGEKVSMDEWPGFLEIKGRVRADALEKFVQELHSSRRRAIMVAHFRWKEGSPESGRASLAETADAYAADERVGLAGPAPGVELYLCPPHGRTIQMLEKHTPKEHLEALASIVDGLIGVVIWRRKPRVTSPPRKHSNSRKHSASRRRSSNADVTQKPSFPAPANAVEPPPEEDAGDVPPGFGPRAAAAGDEDDLPEFDFRRAQPTAARAPGRGGGTSRPHGRPPSRPAEQMRELIHRYGGDGIPSASHGQGQLPPVQPWDEDEDDDIPEWQPRQETRLPLHLMPPNSCVPASPASRQLPPPPLPTSVRQRPPDPGAMRGEQLAWHAGVLWPRAPVPGDAQAPRHGAVGGFGDLRNVTDWRSDVHRGRGV